MADGYDRFDNEGGGGGSFVMGLLTGTVLGAGLGMLFAPKAGSELRNQLSEQAGNLANTASEGYRRASENAAGRHAAATSGRGDLYDKAQDAVARGADEAQRYVRDARRAQQRRSPADRRHVGSSGIVASAARSVRERQLVERPSGSTGAAAAIPAGSPGGAPDRRHVGIGGSRRS